MPLIKFAPLWKRKSKKTNKDFLGGVINDEAMETIKQIASGKIEVDGVMLFENQQKQNDRQPDYNIMLSVSEDGGSESTPPPAPPTPQNDDDEDVPF